MCLACDPPRSRRLHAAFDHARRRADFRPGRRIRKPAEENDPRDRRDQSDLDGSFTLQNVVPGTYTVTAIADGWDLDWSKPGVISNYAKNGQTIVVPAHAEHTVRVPEAVEVQPK